jgi:sugar phosphate isomerase/epimerase
MIDWNRRQFLGAAALAAAPKHKQVSVGAHLWVYSAKQPRYDAWPVLDQVFSELGGAGLDGIELMHLNLLHDESIARITELSKRNNLPVIGSSWSAALWNKDAHAAALAECRTVMERLHQVGGRTFGLSVGDAKRKKTPAELDDQAVAVRQVLRLGANNAITVNLHNHTYEVIDGEHDLNGTIARVPEVKLGPDLGWLYRAKIDPVDFITRHASRMIFAHLRNEKADGKWPETLEEGVIDYAAIGRKLHEIGFAGDLMIELAHEGAFVPTRPLGESVKLSREYVKKVIGY